MAIRHIESEVGGKSSFADPNREIGFGFVSCSCRACVRACEAVWARGHVILNAGALASKISDSGVHFSFFIFAAIRKGFKDFAQALLVYARVLRLCFA